jgi:bifunctional UDP-N-acetylglucosamine pyrophosphorylase/glucosamine-1-phosphate N-acetyltransferase
MASAVTVCILAAGQGKRMRSPGAKVLHPICGRPMLAWVIDQALTLDPRRVLVVVGHGADDVRAWADAAGLDPRVAFVDQPEQRGTGDAARVCLPELDEGTKSVVVLYGDMPCLRPDSLAALVATRGDGAALLTVTPDQPRGFGRILRDDAGRFTGIVEERDATPEQRAIPEVNVGVYAFAADDLRRHLPNLSADNAQGEYYLTDVVGLVRAGGAPVTALEVADERETIGINTLGHLAEARAEIQERILEEHLANGVRIEDPATTFIDHGVEIGPGTDVLPCTVIRSGVRIGAGCEVGPFTHLRVGTVLEDGAEVGNFTEAKQARVGRGTKAKHLTYLGDVEIGSGANIGAGTIVANYDGTTKHRSHVGDRAFVGSGTVLIAPAHVGEGAVTGGGAVVTRGSKIAPGETWVGVPARPLRRNQQKADDAQEGER